MEAGLSLGSNLGNRLGQLKAAVEHIGRLRGVKIVGRSPVYETDPVGVPAPFSGKAFLNAVVLVSASGTPARLLKMMQGVEEALGRTRSPLRNAPRVIDIDVVYADLEVIQTPELVLPHPRWAARRFVVQPLADLRPDLVLPGEPRPVREVLLALPDLPKVVLFKQNW